MSRILSNGGGGVCVWQGGVHSRGACMAGGMHGRGHAWQGCAWQGRVACMAGGMHGVRHAWQGACMAGGMCGGRCVWKGGMHGGMHGKGGHAWQEKQQLQWVIRILLECILVIISIMLLNHIYHTTC